MSRKILLSIVGVVLLFTGIGILWMPLAHPPEKRVAEATILLAEAQKAAAPMYAKAEFALAQSYYDSAMVEWNQQNEKYRFFRTYERMSQLIDKSIAGSRMAIEQSTAYMEQNRNKLAVRLHRLQKNIKVLEGRFATFPIEPKYLTQLSACKMQLSECRLAFEAAHYATCAEKADTLQAQIQALQTVYTHRLNAYFSAYPHWQALTKQAIASSKTNKNNVLVVDKFSRKLLVYSRGVLLQSYAIELGPNWTGDKVQQGDKMTPEGCYTITVKKQNGQTRYHKALLLNYPNDDDKKRFENNKKNGLIKPNAHIGNLIEIHGHGGKGTDWTDGCIALNNEDMNEVFSLCSVGTKVTIVGSVKSLKDLMLH